VEETASAPSRGQAVSDISRQLQAGYRAATNIDADIFVCQSSAGAGFVNRIMISDSMA